MHLSEGKKKHLKALFRLPWCHCRCGDGSAREPVKINRPGRRHRRPAKSPDEMMIEFKTAVTRILTPHASAILLDPEWGIPASKARASNAGLLLAYEKTGYDATTPGRLPDCCRTCPRSASRISAATRSRFCSTTRLTIRPDVNDIKHAFCERIGAECEAEDIPFFLEFVGYDPKGGDEKGFEYAKAKPEIVIESMKEFSKPQYRVDVLKVEIPINANYTEGSKVFKGPGRLYVERGARHFPPRRVCRHQAVIYLSAGVSNDQFNESLRMATEAGHRLLGRAVRPRYLERWHPGIRQAGFEGARRLAVHRRRQEYPCRQRIAWFGQALVCEVRPHQHLNMTKQQVLAAMLDIGIVPVVRTTSAESAILAIEAIYNGGIRAAEITMTVPGALKALEKVADKFGDKIVLGAGTVLDPETARICTLAGAEFFVTPALKPATIEMARRYSKVICTGALTPTEVLTAWEAGSDIVKVFPCGAVGGPKYIKALKGPLPQIEMVPTGGVNLETAGEFLKAGACAVAVGGELVDPKLIKSGKYDEMTKLAEQYLAVIAKARAEMKG
jgi:tagatose 1,6-diphosphate aldolase